MCVFSTSENKKDECLDKTLQSLSETVDFARHRLILSVNGSTDATKYILGKHHKIIEDVIWNEKNLGTAEGINRAWKLRNKGEHLIKMDDDIVIHQSGWLDDLEQIVERDPTIGQIGLKRKDLEERPWHESPLFKSILTMIPQEKGQRWFVVEEVKHVIGSCVLHSSKLIDNIGYLKQPNIYGFDDVLASARTRVAGFKCCFYPFPEIEHIDDGQTPWQKEKEEMVNQQWAAFQELERGYLSGEISVYYNPFQ